MSRRTGGDRAVMTFSRPSTDKNCHKRFARKVSLLTPVLMGGTQNQHRGIAGRLPSGTDPADGTKLSHPARRSPESLRNPPGQPCCCGEGLDSLDWRYHCPGGGMADAEDLKSSGDFSSCGFDSHPGHQSFLLKMNELLGRSFPCTSGVHTFPVAAGTVLTTRLSADVFTQRWSTCLKEKGQSKMARL